MTSSTTQLNLCNKLFETVKSIKMKKSIFTLILTVIISYPILAQVTYLTDTAFVSDIGFGGAPASCKANGMIYNSVNMDRSQGIWAADAFTIPLGATWIFDTVIVYGYQYGSGLSSPFTACNLQIYSGAPGLGGTAVWGDAVTNILSSSAFTGIYKVDTLSSDNGLLSTKRPIMYLKLFLSPAPRLNAGTYWLSWSATCATASSSAATPYKVLPTRENPSGQKARVLVSGSWQYVVDNADTAGLNMIIKSSANLAVEPLEKNNIITKLNQNIPNPFNDVTTINYTLAEGGNVDLLVYNALGQIVTTLVDGYMSQGEHYATFYSDNFPSGIYYYRLISEAGIISKEMVLFK